MDRTSLESQGSTRLRFVVAGPPGLWLLLHFYIALWVVHGVIVTGDLNIEVDWTVTRTNRGRTKFQGTKYV